MNIITPIIHLNGDRKETLIDALRAAYKALRLAETAMKNCAPNMRNFYPEPGRFDGARLQHNRRMQTLYDLKQSLIDEVDAIEDTYGA